MNAATTRVRGFAPWRPSAESQALLDVVKTILVEYRSISATNHQAELPLARPNGVTAAMTTTPNAEMSELHDRTPVILDQQDWPT